MSYSTRRSGGFGGQQQQQNVANIGQRRPVVTNNFVPGGQNKPAGQVTQQQVRAQQPPQQNTSIQFRSQGAAQQQAKQQSSQAKQPQPQIKQQQPQVKVPQQPNQQQQQTQQQQTQQPTQVQQQPTQVQPPPVHQQPQQQAQQQQIEMETTPAQNNTFAPSAENAEEENADLEAMDTSAEVVKKKPFWFHNKGKIAKKERTRRRNVMLTRTLKPKNAVMILNELVKSTTYAVEELPTKFNGCSFKATVVYEGAEHVGYGRNKMQAKNAAAETALKHFVKSHKLSEMKKDEEGNEKMDLSEEDAQNPLPWQHVVSFALFKLFCSWDDGSNESSLNSEVHELKQAKKMPANPETVNPLMMVNQMLPQANFEEIGKTGVPPHIVFSFKCIVDDETFIGTGPNKKAAKRMAAYGACHKILGINYPEEVYVPNY